MAWLIDADGLVAEFWNDTVSLREPLEKNLKI